MERIRDLMGRIAELSSDELSELATLIGEQAGTIEGNSPEEVVLLNELAEAADAQRDALVARQAAEEQAAQDAAAARDRITGKAKPAEPTAEEPAEDPDGGEDPEAPEAVVTDTPEVAVVASRAGGSRIRRLAATGSTPKPSPEVLPAGPAYGAVMTASSAIGNIGGPTGAIEDPMELAEAMTRLLNGMSRHDAPRGRVLCASATWDYPEDRKLSSDSFENEKKFRSVIGPRGFLSGPALDEALVASGGVCAPVNVDYTVPGWSTQDRPLRDALPAFQADRGGLTYVTPGDIGTYANATEVWTEATDANPAGATKPVVQVVCGTPVTTYVNAIPTRLGFGNMTARFAPEQTAADTDLAMSQAARTAEIELLQLIAASCIADVTSATLLGATRDLVTVIDQVIAGYRSYHRIPESVKFTAIFPSWVKNLLRVDLAREIGHSQNDYFDALQITDQYIEDMISMRGVNPVWHIDGQSASQLSGAGSTAQIFGSQGASGAVNAFPTKVVWYIFPEGAFQFLDAGRLDLGVVRDSTLDATNDYETFVETFEGIAFRGFTSGALQMVSTLCANGGTAGTISTSGDCA